jgi:hypothetical protein
MNSEKLLAKARRDLERIRTEMASVVKRRKKLLEGDNNTRYYHSKANGRFREKNCQFVPR